MKDKILKEYSILCDDIQNNYNQIKIIDTYDFDEDSPYTIIYLNKNDSFEKFETAWKKTKEEFYGEDYDTIYYEFEKENDKKFDFINLGLLNVFTDSEYELNI